MQRLYSEFPAACPGLGLLLLRLLTCGIIMEFEGIRPTSVVAESRTFAESFSSGLLIAAGVLILAGFLTPLTVLLVAVVEGVSTISQIVNSGDGSERDWIYSLLITGTASALTLTGPGGFSLDAAIFGPKRLFIPLDNSASTHVPSSSGQKSSQSRN